MDIDDYWTAVKKIKRQEKEIATLRKWQRDMVAKMAEDHDLAGYREMGEKLAARDEEIETLRETIKALEAGKDYYAELAADSIEEFDKWKRKYEDRLGMQDGRYK